jgi:hypothetical protein
MGRVFMRGVLDGWADAKGSAAPRDIPALRRRKCDRRIGWEFMVPNDRPGMQKEKPGIMKYCIKIQLFRHHGPPFLRLFLNLRAAQGLARG